MTRTSNPSPDLDAARRTLQAQRIDGTCVALFDQAGKFIDCTAEFAQGLFRSGGSKDVLLGETYDQVLDRAVREYPEFFEDPDVRSRWQVGKLNAFASADGIQRIFKSINGEWDLLSYHRLDRGYTAVCRSGTIFRSHEMPVGSGGVPLKVLIAIAERTSNGVITTDASGLITWVNPAFTSNTGYTLGQIRGRNPGKILQGPLTDPETVREMGMKIRSKLGFRVEVLNYRTDGTSFWVDVEVLPVLDNCGDLEGFVSIQADISEAKNRTLALEQAKDQAIATERMKSEFLAVMSHEIRTPLNGIIGLLELATGKRDEQVSMRYVEQARELASSLIQVVSDTLDLSRMDAGKLVEECVAFDPEDMLRSATATIAAEAHRKGIVLGIVCPDFLPPKLLGSPSRIRQVLVNLLANALKFTECGSVSVYAAYDSGDGLSLWVTDTGPGISSESLSTIFEPYVQLGGQLQVRHRGFGLGLSIVHRLVKHMGGSIQIDSKLGVGTSICVRLPLAPAEGPDGAAEQERPLAGIRYTASDTLLEVEPMLQRWLDAAGAKPWKSPADDPSVEIHGPMLVLHDCRERPKRDATTRRFGDIGIVVADEFTQGGDIHDETQAVRYRLVRPLLPRSTMVKLHALVQTADVLGDRNRCASTTEPLLSNEGGPRRLLLVEDDSVNALVADAALSTAGWEVTCAPTGSRAMWLLQHTRFEFVLVDLNLPDRPGTEVIHCARALQKSLGLQFCVAVWSAQCGSPFSLQDNDVPADAFIPKPIEPSRLVKEVNLLFGHGEADQSTHSGKLHADLE
jgi:two-component system sensor histidine kinase/response regulator